MRIAAVLAGLVALGAPAQAWAQHAEARPSVAAEFREISADAIVSADLELPEIWPPSDLEQTDDGYVARRSPGVSAQREEQHCTLDPAAIAGLIDILKRSTVIADAAEGLGADIVIRFRVRGGRQIIAVLSDPNDDESDGPSMIFFDERTAMLGLDGHAAVRRIATAAGCRP